MNDNHSHSIIDFIDDYRVMFKKISNDLHSCAVLLLMVTCTAGQCAAAQLSENATAEAREQVLGASVDSAEDTPGSELPEDWSAHAQLTWVEQRKNNFNSPRSGQESLLSQSEGDARRSYSMSSTLYLGAKVWQGGEVYYNPEVFTGLPFSNSLQGLGGVQNGELQKGAYPSPVAYTARAFVRQTFGLGGGQDMVTPGVSNQLGEVVDKNRVVLTWGKVASLDFFDQNTFSHDSRTQFMNFAIFSMGAYGYAADIRGFTYGVVGEWYQGDWIVRAARLAAPTLPNTLNLDYTLSKDYVDQIEITHNHNLYGQPGHISGLVFNTHALMAKFDDAVQQGEASGETPNILSSRYRTQQMYGFGLNVEQSITSRMGVFARLSWNNDQTETETLDMGQSFSAGARLHGALWGRPDDTFGAAWAISGISNAEIRYLQLGGYTAFIGDGFLQYRAEQITESYYSAKLCSGCTLTADYQRIANPAYNGARGPVNILGMRLHYEF